MQAVSTVFQQALVLLMRRRPALASERIFRCRFLRPPFGLFFLQTPNARFHCSPILVLLLLASVHREQAHAHTHIFRLEQQEAGTVGAEGERWKGEMEEGTRTSGIL